MKKLFTVIVVLGMVLTTFARPHPGFGAPFGGHHRHYHHGDIVAAGVGLATGLIGGAIIGSHYREPTPVYVYQQSSPTVVYTPPAFVPPEVVVNSQPQYQLTVPQYQVQTPVQVVPTPSPVVNRTLTVTTSQTYSHTTVTTYVPPEVVVNSQPRYSYRVYR